MRNDQPFLTINYNTDQFVDPIKGYTVHDDGSLTYTQPETGIIYTKQRFYNGMSNGYVSYKIDLIAAVIVGGGYVTEDGNTFYTAEDGTTIYIQET